MESAPRLLEHLSVQDAEHFAQVRELLDVAGVAYEVDPTLVRGPRLLHAHRVRVHLRCARRAERGGGRRTLRRPGRAARRAADAGHGLGGRDRADPARGERPGAPPPEAAPEPAPPAPVELFVALDGQRDDLRTAAFGLLSEARSAGLSAQMELGGRSLKGQLGHADALGARYVAIVGDEQTVLKDMQAGEQEPIATNAVVHAVLRGQHAL